MVGVSKRQMERVAMTCSDHKYERGAYGVCKRCGGEDPQIEKIVRTLEPKLKKLAEDFWAKHPNNPDRIQ